MPICPYHARMSQEYEMPGGRWQSAYGTCGATTKHGAKPCRMMALKPGGRCVWHGGMSVGARTLEGRFRQLRALPNMRGKSDDEVRARAAELLAAAEQRYIRLRREADRRRGRQPLKLVNTLK